MDEGKWFLVLPAGVTFKGSSLPSLQAVGSLLVLDPLVINAKKWITFTVTVEIQSTASGRLVFHSFLNDPDTYCEAVASVTVRSLTVCFTFVCLSSAFMSKAFFPTCLTDVSSSFCLIHIAAECQRRPAQEKAPA